MGRRATEPRMAEPSISFRLQAVDGRGLLGQRRHDLRLGRQPSYVDPEQSHRNVRLHRAQGFGPDEAARNFVSHGRYEIELRARRVTEAKRYWRTAIVTFSHEAQARLAERGVLPHDEALRAFEDFAARHGVRMLSADFHGDESAPHYHATFEGVDAAGYALRLGKPQLSAEQDRFAAHFAAHGLVRGKRRADREAEGEAPSNWVNRSVRELHQQLPGELAALQARIEAAREKAATNERRAAKAQSDLDACKGDAEKVRKRMETYEARAAHARAEVEALDAQLADKRAGLDRLTRQHAELDAALAQKKTTIAGLRERLRSLSAA